MPEEKLLKEVTAERDPGGETPENSRDHRTAPDHRNDEERRASSRYTVSAFAEVIEPQTHTRLRGRATDLGRGGCYVDTINPFPVGTDVQVRLASGRRTFLSQAYVIYAISGMGMGLAFTKMAPKQATILQNWVGELSGELEPKAEEEPVPAPPPEPDTGPDEAPHLGDAVAALVGLLARKHLLTETEASELRKKLSP